MCCRFLDTPKLAGPPNVFALGALAALGASGTAWDSLRTVTEGRLGERGIAELTRVQEKVLRE